MIALDRAIALHRAGDLDAAQAAYLDIIAQNPDDAEAIGWVGILAHQRGRPDAALDLFDRALGLAPGLDHLHAHRCVALCALDRLEEALAAIMIAEQRGVDPQHCLLTRANILCDLGRYDAGAALYEQALAADPDLIPARLHLGMARWRQENLSAAESAYREALLRHPELVDAHYGLGLVHRARGDLSAAAEAQRAAVALQPDHAQAQLELAELDLLAGRFMEGFARQEWRYRLPHAIGLLPQFDVPAWDGAALNGRALFVYAEQGYGDAIQFARFLPVAAARGARIVLGVSAPLERLFAGFPGVERLVTDWMRAAPYQAHAPLSSLPRLLGVRSAQDIPTAPYLSADPDAVARLRTHIGVGTGLKVGLAWSGRPENPNDPRRSIPVAHLAPLSGCGARLYSLQRDAPPPADLACGDLGPLLADFAETAAAVAALDLVIAVDTAIAHLAGAMGKPVWIMLPYAPDWRWRLDRADSDWHATARLFRQPRPGDWDSVVAAVAAALREAVATAAN